MSPMSYQLLYPAVCGCDTAPFVRQSYAAREPQSLRRATGTAMKNQNTTLKRFACAFVAGAGFEPATFGL